MMCFIWMMNAHKWLHNHFLTYFANMLSNVRVYFWLKFSFTTSLVIVRVHKIVNFSLFKFLVTLSTVFSIDRCEGLLASFRYGALQ